MTVTQRTENRSVPEQLPSLPAPLDADIALRTAGRISVLVVAHDMHRALPRTLYSLSAAYQRGASNLDYEVIVVDNGSEQPVSTESISRFGENFRLIRIDDAHPSPTCAMNLAERECDGDFLCLMIDGARMVTPGLLQGLSLARRLHPKPVVGCSGWHLGPDLQWRSRLEGYDESIEDALLASSDWMRDGYRLFTVAVPAASSAQGPFMPMAECNTLGINRSHFRELGGMDPQFDLPGGGYVNLDLYRRAVESPDAQLVVLIGEASFHQLHGGVSTNSDPTRRVAYGRQAKKQYVRLRGGDFSPPSSEPLYLGRVHPAAARPLALSLEVFGRHDVDQD